MSFLLQRCKISRKSPSKMRGIFGGWGQKFSPKSCENLRIDANNFPLNFFDEYWKFCRKSAILYALRSAVNSFSVSRYTRKLGSVRVKKGFCQQIYKKFKNYQQIYKKWIPCDSDTLAFEDLDFRLWEKSKMFWLPGDPLVSDALDVVSACFCAIPWGSAVCLVCLVGTRLDAKSCQVDELRQWQVCPDNCLGGLESRILLVGFDGFGTIYLLLLLPCASPSSRVYGHTPPAICTGEKVSVKWSCTFTSIFQTFCIYHLSIPYKDGDSVLGSCKPCEGYFYQVFCTWVSLRESALMQVVVYQVSLGDYPKCSSGRDVQFLVMQELESVVDECPMTGCFHVIVLLLLRCHGLTLPCSIRQASGMWCRHDCTHIAPTPSGVHVRVHPVGHRWWHRG